MKFSEKHIFRYANNDDIRLFNLGFIALFSNFRLTTSSGKHLEHFSHAHIVPSMYKLIPSTRDSVDLSIVFDRDRNRRREELTNNKKVKTMLKICLRIYLVLQNIEKKLLLA